MSEDEKKLCDCVFDTFIENRDGCVYPPDNEEHPELDWRNKLYSLERHDNFHPDYLVLFNNENIHWNDEEYYKVYRIVDCCMKYDMTIFEPLGIVFYTNGMSGKQGVYLMMIGREVVTTSRCPILYSTIKNFLSMNDVWDVYDKVIETLVKRGEY